MKAARYFFKKSEASCRKWKPCRPVPPLPTSRESALASVRRTGPSGKGAPRVGGSYSSLRTLLRVRTFLSGGLHHSFNFVINFILFYLLYFFKKILFIFLDRGEGREKERERNINVWLPLTHPTTWGTWPTTRRVS